jgi:hypothetical protein
MTEPRYTLDEAKAEIARQECATYGHDYMTVVWMGGNEPTGVTCSRCGQHWPIAPTTQERQA